MARDHALQAVSVAARGVRPGDVTSLIDAAFKAGACPTMVASARHRVGGACSSMVEPAAHNGQVAGSSPAGPTKLLASQTLTRGDHCPKGGARRGVAQSGSAFGLGPKGRRFESYLPDHLLWIAAT